MIGSNSVGRPTPALAINKSTGPSVLASPWMADTVCVRSPTSAGAVAAVPPAFWISAASSSSLSLRRATRPTLQPSAARSFASHQPMPLLAPVITAT